MWLFPDIFNSHIWTVHELLHQIASCLTEIGTVNPFVGLATIITNIPMISNLPKKGFCFLVKILNTSLRVRHKFNY